MYIYNILAIKGGNLLSPINWKTFLKEINKIYKPLQKTKAQAFNGVSVQQKYERYKKGILSKFDGAKYINFQESPKQITDYHILYGNRGLISFLEVFLNKLTPKQRKQLHFHDVIFQSIKIGSEKYLSNNIHPTQVNKTEENIIRKPKMSIDLSNLTRNINIKKSFSSGDGWDMQENLCVIFSIPEDQFSTTQLLLYSAVYNEFDYSAAVEEYLEAYQELTKVEVNPLIYFPMKQFLGVVKSLHLLEVGKIRQKIDGVYLKVIIDRHFLQKQEELQTWMV